MSDDVIILDSTPVKVSSSLPCPTNATLQIILSSPVRPANTSIVELSSDDTPLEKMMISSLPLTSSPSKLFVTDSASYDSAAKLPMDKLFPDITDNANESMLFVSQSCNSSFHITVPEKKDDVLPQVSQGSFMSDLSELEVHVRKKRSIFYDSDDDMPNRTKITSIKPMGEPEPPIVKQSKKSKKKKSTKQITKPIFNDPEDHLDELLTYYKNHNTKNLKLVNKTNRSKDELLQEMTVVFDNSITFSDELLDSLKPITITESAFNQPLIKFKRQANSLYYKEEDLFIPSDTTTIDEKFIILYYKVNDEFAQLLHDGKLAKELHQLRQLNKDHCIILLMESHDLYLSKLKSKENRIFTDQIRQQLNESRPTSKSTNIIITKDQFETKLLDLQLKSQIHLFPTKTDHDSVNWIKLFTYTISSLRYDKMERLSQYSNIGVVQKGSDDKSCYLKSLQHLKFITPLVSEKIYSEFPNLQQLGTQFTRFEKLGKSYVRESVDQSLFKFFNSDNIDELLFS